MFFKKTLPSNLLVLLTTITLTGTFLTACNPSSQNTPPQSTSTTPEEDTLKLLYWQAPTILNPHLATGTKDYEGARIIYEPLASLDQKGDFVPFLAAEIPSRENGGLSEDGKSVTWKLRQGVKWSDGTPFTAQDVVFTYEFISNPEVAATTTANYAGIDKVEALDEHTVKITFQQPQPAWYAPFTGQNGMILPEHIFAEYNGINVREAPANLKPVGTGPYQVLDFKPGDVMVLEANELYWDEGKPYFNRVELKGGGDATSAARAVLQTGDADFAYNLQVEAKILQKLEAAGKGKVVTVFGGDVERIMINFTNPQQGSKVEFPHPFFSDPRVRLAFTHAMDRDTISQQLYGSTGAPTSQLLVAPQELKSPKISSEFDLKKAADLLDEAGWQDTNGNGVRDKDGVEMKVVFATSVNPVRQKTQAIVKQALKSIGVDVELKSVDASIFFGGDPSNPDTINRFNFDLQEYTTGNESPDPTAYMKEWTCDEIATEDNNWQKNNYARYCNPEYDLLWEAASQELDPAQRAKLFQQMDELLYQDSAVIPLVARADANGISNRLQGINPTPWDASTWDIKNWQHKS